MAQQEKIQQQQLEEVLKSRLQQLQDQQVSPSPTEAAGPRNSSDGSRHSFSNGSAQQISLLTPDTQEQGEQARRVLTDTRSWRLWRFHSVFVIADGLGAGDMEVGKISFSPTEVLGHGAEGTFVFR